MQQAYAHARAANQGGAELFQNGDGSPRSVETSHTFLLMIMHPSWSWRLGEHLPTQQLGIGAHSIYELTVGSSSISGYDGFVLFCLSEHLQPVRERGSMEKGQRPQSEGT